MGWRGSNEGGPSAETPALGFVKPLRCRPATVFSMSRVLPPLAGEVHQVRRGVHPRLHRGPTPEVTYPSARHSQHRSLRHCLMTQRRTQGTRITKRGIHASNCNCSSNFLGNIELRAALRHETAR
jgi:hypothetical protein